MPNKTEIIFYSLLAFTQLFSLLYSFSDPDFFNDVLMKEDGVVEYATFIMLLAVSILCWYRLFVFWKAKKTLWRLGTFIFALLFFFAAGEEISWGQRFFNIETGDFFSEHNVQSETNLHNLKIGDTKINVLIFSQLLTLLMVIYLIVVPILYRKTKFIKNLADKFAVPVVRWHHTIAFALATVIILLMQGDRKWEVYELAFSVIFFLIFLFPLNARIFRSSSEN